MAQPVLNNHVRPGARILDIGCGAGIPLTLALSNTFDVTGVDIYDARSNWHEETYRLHISFRAMSQR